MSLHLTRNELDASLAWILGSPRDAGTLEMIVARPAVDERVVLETALLTLEDGLAGDSWRARGSRRTDDGCAHPDAQLTLMNARVIQTVARERDRWPLAGDQLYLDLDLSHESLQPGNRLHIGSALVEITGVPSALVRAKATG